MTLQYEEIYSQFYLQMTDSSFYKLSENQAYDMMTSWLHDAIGVPYIRKIFSKITFDDKMMILTYALKNPLDDNSDNDFVIGIFAQYMVIAWMRPQVDSALELATFIGTKEEKMLKSNYKTNIARLEHLEQALRKKIRDYGYQYNDYLAEA